MVAEGLSCPLCWATLVFRQGHTVRIGSAGTLASLTEEELAAAKAWRGGDSPESDDG